jgi:hypothetical protein
MIWGLRQGMPHRPHSSSASRLTAGASGFFILVSRASGSHKIFGYL